jgi:hypothetical protein
MIPVTFYILEPHIVIVYNALNRILQKSYALTRYNSTNCRCSNRKAAEKNSATQQPITVFVHGTLPPLLSKLAHFFDIPLGLTPALTQGNNYYMGRIPFILNKADKNQFPLESSYLFGWSGELDFAARKKAAYQLYNALKTLQGQGPITLITHSHGGNVALNLALVTEEQQDTSFSIERLIILAAPVQHATAHLVSSPIFKTIISLYSLGDLTQILDPQGLYKESNILSNTVPLFSERLYKPSHNLVQASIFINRRKIRHITFISKRFLSKLPMVLQAIKDFCCKKDTETLKEAHFKVFITSCFTCQPYTITYKE